MSEINCPVMSALQKIRNPDKVFKDVNIAVMFETLPQMKDWTQPLLDMATKTFLNNLIYALAKRGANIRVTDESDSLTNVMAKRAWSRYSPECPEATFTMVSPATLLDDVKVVVAIGLKEETIELLNSKDIEVVVVNTGKNEVFPKRASVIKDTEVESSVNPSIRAIQDILKV